MKRLRSEKFKLRQRD